MMNEDETEETMTEIVQRTVAEFMERQQQQQQAGRRDPTPDQDQRDQFERQFRLKELEYNEKREARAHELEMQMLELRRLSSRLNDTVERMRKEGDKMSKGEKRHEREGETRIDAGKKSGRDAVPRR